MLLANRIPVRYLVEKIRKPLLSVLVITTIVEFIVEAFRADMPDVPPSIAAFLGTAISLVLSFKLNQSYDRWWEARKVWGAIVNDSRTLVRQGLAFACDGSEIVHAIARRQIAWCYCLGQSLRGLDWKRGTDGHLAASEVEEADGHANPALALSQFQARNIAKLADGGHLTDYQRVAMDDTLTRLIDSQGRAERIRNTVFPRTYGIFLHAFIYLFVVVLSIALSEVEGAWQIALTTAISLPFFALERTAVHMQDPFANRPTDTSVTAIARTIEINLLQLIGEREVPGPLADEGFYVM
jgi:putative membrane protein